MRCGLGVLLGKGLGLGGDELLVGEVVDAHSLAYIVQRGSCRGARTLRALLEYGVYLLDALLEVATTLADGVEQLVEDVDEQLLARDEAIEALSAERDMLRLKVEELAGALAVAKEERESAVAKKDTVCAILCNLRAVLEAVLAYKAE